MNQQPYLHGVAASEQQRLEAQSKLLGAAEGRVWTVTGQDRSNLQLYVNGAREIIQQATPHLIEAQTVTPTLLQQAENEYQLLFSRSDAFVLHGFCRAIGSKGK